MKNILIQSLFLNLAFSNIKKIILREKKEENDKINIFKLFPAVYISKF